MEEEESFESDRGGSRGGTSCSVPLCPHYSGSRKSVGIHFFKFPAEKDLRLPVRIQRMKRANWKPSGSSCVCSDHFLESDYVSVTKKGTPAVRPKLNMTATPSVFSCLPETVRPAGTSTKRRRSPTERGELPPPPPPRFPKRECQTEMTGKDIDSLRKQVSDMSVRIQTLSNTVGNQQEEIQRLTLECSRLHSEKVAALDKCSADIKQLEAANAELQEHAKKQEFS